MKQKQLRMLRLILSFYEKGLRALDAGADFSKVISLPVRERIGRAKAVPYEGYKKEYADIADELERELEDVIPD